MRAILWMCLLFAMAGCATKTVKIVDGKGRPVEGALVITETRPYIFNPWRIGAYVSGKNGKVKVVSSIGHIFKPGFYPVINSAESDMDFLYRNPTHFQSDIAPIYAISKKGAFPVKTTSYMTNKKKQQGQF